MRAGERGSRWGILPAAHRGGGGDGSRWRHTVMPRSRWLRRGGHHVALLYLAWQIFASCDTDSSCFGALWRSSKLHLIRVLVSKWFITTDGFVSSTPRRTSETRLRRIFRWGLIFYSIPEAEGRSSLTSFIALELKSVKTFTRQRNGLFIFIFIFIFQPPLYKSSRISISANQFFLERCRRAGLPPRTMNEPKFRFMAFKNRFIVCVIKPD